ncbi:dimethyl sulfoxide reductase subunit A [Symbiobacterium thermophilum]|uniref:Anaerobic dimethyl sulfoxide reductase subunit A n=4 Tax=Symbiobacterium thermophilum TaxID=2734 RepID=Q67RJ5_SYMTH|nr:dimethyl sulfoxide reductase subunit A [Symbiobacterium thermophilum]MBY6274700.1 dimethyl sulfoxide reductase subunit A [Symbiobacterium thermophilum]BAD39698.1 anaerobic dimethyl sulfoxide reductase subunit A [Symbiobacterium thermophilum IAM 14863]
MAKLIRSAGQYKLDRRRFLGWSAATAGAALLLGNQTGLLKLDPAKAKAAPAAEEGKWVTAACWHNCGGRCLNKALVRDGVVIRQKTDDTHEDSPDFPQQRGCARGRSQRKQVFAVDRLRYPMKRKHWEPGGGRKDLRGRDEWVRISWDEALDIVASEIKRIVEKYGNRAILSTGGSEIGRTLALYGGYVGTWGTTSWGSWRWGPAKFGMAEGYNDTSINDRLDLRNSNLIVIWGGNPAWSAGGSPTYHYLQAKKAGAKFIFIDPIYHQSAELLADEWIPIRPGTDHAMMLGMAYTLITEDDPVNNPLIDWDFLNRCTVGFDADHMPEGADPKENFKDYVLGTYDGQPKTPEWASEICGVDPHTIRRLAREIATTPRVALLTAWAPARTRNSDSWPQMFMTFGAMTGHMGQPGRMTGVSCHRHTANGGPNLVTSGGAGLPGIKNPINESINDSELWNAVLTGKYTAGYNDVRDINIQMIYHGGGAILQTRDGMTKGIEAHRHVEFVVSHSQFLTTNSKYADIVLPVTTPWERLGGLLTGNREILIYYTNVTQPLFEAKDDAWIATEIAKRLGFKEEDIYPISEKQQLFNQLAGSKVMKEDGSGYEPLLTITEEDIAEWGVEGKPQQGRITLKEFEERGIYQVPRRPGDKLGFIAYEAFRKDPENNPLNTASGKLEIHCQALADLIKGYGFTEIDPIPTYQPRKEGYEDTFADWEKKIKGEYPLQVINPHYPRRSHSVFDNVTWLREAFPSMVMLNSQDAAARGIKDGDTVLITSRHGKVLRRAHVTDLIMPGVVGLPHGAWVEMDEEKQIDKAGADNILCGGIPSGQGISAWNSCIVEVTRYDEPLAPDHTWEPRIPLK